MFYTTYEEWLRTHRPISGADGEDDDDTSTAGDTDTDTEDTSNSDSDTDTTTDDDTSSSGDDDTDTAGDADEDELERIKSDRDQARTELAKAQAAARKAKEEARKAREDAAKKHGNWEQVAKERQSEIEDLTERLQKAETDKVTADENLDSFRREVRVTRLANKLGFRDSQDAMNALKDKPELTGDDKSCERALRKLGSDKPYLLDMKRARGRSMSDSNGTMLLTKDQLDKMTPAQVNENWDLVQRSVAALGSGGG